MAACTSCSAVQIDVETELKGDDELPPELAEVIWLSRAFCPNCPPSGP